MADVLSRIYSLSPRLHRSDEISDQDYDSQMQSLVAYLREAVSNEASDIGSDLLDTLDPSFYSVPYLFVLHSQVRAFRSKKSDYFPDGLCPSGKLWTKTLQFLSNFDAIQMRYVGHEWHQLIEALTRSALAASKPLLAVQPIRDAVLRMDPSCAVLTSTHVALVKLCLCARVYTPALAILDKTACQFPTGVGQAGLDNHRFLPCTQHQNQNSAHFTTGTSGFSTKMTYKEHLEYFLYGAMIYMVLGNWEKALHFLDIVISCPVVNSVSTIMVEAYKKWILTSLLGNGKLVRTTETISSHTMKIYRSLARPYLAVAGAFESGDYQRLEAEVELGQSIWDMDHNTGLVHQLLDSFKKYIIHRLGKTFSALTVAGVWEHASTHIASKPKTETLVASLIMSKALNATLSHSNDAAKSAMLRFSCASMVCSISRDIYMHSQLLGGEFPLAPIVNCVEEGCCSLELCKEYIEMFKRNNKQGDGNGGHMNMGGTGEFSIEEDMMGDLS